MSHLLAGLLCDQQNSSSPNTCTPPSWPFSYLVSLGPQTHTHTRGRMSMKVEGGAVRNDVMERIISQLIYIQIEFCKKMYYVVSYLHALACRRALLGLPCAVLGLSSTRDLLGMSCAVLGLSSTRAILGLSCAVLGQSSTRAILGLLCVVLGPLCAILRLSSTTNDAFLREGRSW